MKKRSAIAPTALAVGICFAAAFFSLPQAGGLAEASIPVVTLNNGVKMPMISAGLWQVKPEEATAMIPKAFDIGFNHIDASCVVYSNEVEVGKALSKYDRASYFLTTKLDPLPTWSSAEVAEKTTAQLNACLASHQVDFIDLLLVHWPLGDCATNQKVWRAVEDFHKAGKAKTSKRSPRSHRSTHMPLHDSAYALHKSSAFVSLHAFAVGISNFNACQLDCLMQTATVPPAVNQVLYHLGMGAKHPLQDAMDEHHVVLQAYSPLGAGTTGRPRMPEIINGDLVASIGAKYGKTGPQVSLRWLVQRGVPLAAESTNRAHLQADLDIFDFELSEEDMSALSAYDDGSGSKYARKMRADCP